MPKTLKEQLEAQKAAKATEAQSPAAVVTPTAGEVVQEVAKKVLATEANLDDKIAAAVAKALAAGTSSAIDYQKLGQAVGQAIVAAEAAKQMDGHAKTLAELRKKQAKEEKCHLCGQSVGDGKNSGCGGPFRRAKNGTYVMEPVLEPDGTPARDSEDKPIMRRVEDYHQFHDQMVVFPSEPMAFQCWDGIKVNGALYMSAGPNHKVWVPKALNIAHLLSNYEQGERDARIPKKRGRHGGTVNGRTGGHTGPGVGEGWVNQ
jgi:hypothetical protein